jgi:hypothetical protein
MLKVGTTVEIMFEDLSERKKREILKTFGIKNPEEMNWDIIPITIVEMETEDDKG